MVVIANQRERFYWRFSKKQSYLIRILWVQNKIEKSELVAITPLLEDIVVELGLF